MKRNIELKVLAGSLLLLAFFQGVRYFYISEVNYPQCEIIHNFHHYSFVNFRAHSIFPNYNLYLYGEGKQGQKIAESKIDGIPVLFIPGSAGSYRQVIPLAAAAYRKSWIEFSFMGRKVIPTDAEHFHLDFFTIDFNEELSDWHGGLLRYQTSFVKVCIQRILGLYNITRQSNPHKSLILIGHAMGGVIAKAAIIDMHPSVVNAVITLDTPNSSPIALDKGILNFYQLVDSFWSEKSASQSRQIATLVSVRSLSTELDIHRQTPGFSNASSVAEIFNTQITERITPTIWIDQHLWCRKMVEVVVNSLFDMVEPSTKKWLETSSINGEEVFFNHLLMANSNTYKYGGQEPSPREFDFDPYGQWKEVSESYFTVRATENENYNRYYLIPLIGNRDRLVVVIYNWEYITELAFPVYGCVALTWRESVPFCERGIDLSNQTLIIRVNPDYRIQKLINLNLVELRGQGVSHVVFNIPKYHQWGSIVFDAHLSSDRNLQVLIPFKSYLPFMSVGRVVIPNNAVSYNITFPNLSETWQSISVSVRRYNCTLRRTAIIREIVPWSNENQLFWAENSFSFGLRIARSPSDIENSSVHLQFVNPFSECHYEIEIYTNWSRIWPRLVRFYSPFLVSMIFAILLLCLSKQLRAKQLNRPVPSTVSCLFEMTVFKFLLVLEALGICLRWLDSSHLPAWPNFLVPDEFLLREYGLGFPSMYLLLGVIAWILAIILTSVFRLGISVGGHILHRFIIRKLRSYFGFPLVVVEILLAIPPLFGLFFILNISNTSEILVVGLFFGLAYFIWELMNYYDDNLVWMLSEEESQRFKDEFRSNLTIAFLWLCTASLGLPAFFIWLRNPSLIVTKEVVHRNFLVLGSLLCLGRFSLFLSLLAFAVFFRKSFSLPVFFDHMQFSNLFWNVWAGNGSHKRYSYSSSTSDNRFSRCFAIYAISILMVVYGMASIYRIQYFIAVAIVIYKGYDFSEFFSDIFYFILALLLRFITSFVATG